MNYNFLAKNSITRWALYFYVLSLSVFAQDFDSGVVKTNEHSFTVSTFSDGFEIPWGMAFLPNNDLLVSDRSGKLYRVSNDGKENTEIDGVPEVLYKSQGGLLDVAVHPEFSKNSIIYISYSHALGRKSFTRIAMAKLSGNKLINLKLIFSVDK